MPTNSNWIQSLEKVRDTCHEVFGPRVRWDMGPGLSQHIAAKLLSLCDTFGEPYQNHAAVLALKDAQKRWTLADTSAEVAREAASFFASPSMPLLYKLSDAIVGAPSLDSGAAGLMDKILVGVGETLAKFAEDFEEKNGES